MFLLSYNTNGLRNLSLDSAIEAISIFGYDGVELSLHHSHLHPFIVTDEQLNEVRKVFRKNNIKPICLATGAANLLGETPWEPSLISENKDGRETRIKLIKKSIEIAKYLDIPVVNFASGLKKNNVSDERAMEYLISGIKECLENVGDIILAIEPEPNFFISTTTEAIQLIETINSDKFRLNMDIGHVNCCEEDYLTAINNAVKYTRHIHIEDIKNRIHHHEIPGEGNIDFETIFTILKEQSYEHFLSVELYHHADVYEKALEESYLFLKHLKVGIKTLS